jgi:tetratricopeptide (TPR) repeat protein
MVIAGAALWALDLLGPILAERGITSINPGWRWRLSRRTARRVKGFEPRFIRRFLSRQDVFDLVAAGQEANAEQLQALLAQSLRPKLAIRRDRFTLEKRTAAAELLLPVILSEFLASLDPSHAVAVASKRSDEQFNIVRRQQEQILGVVAVSRDVFEEVRRQLPPNARDYAVDLIDHEPSAARELFDALLLDERGVATASVAIINNPPAWMESSPYRSWLCIGQVALGHGHAREGANALRVAVDRGAPNAGRWYARSALAVAEVDREQADELARMAEQVGGDPLLMLLDALLANDLTLIETAARDIADSGHPDLALAIATQARVQLLQERWDECIATSKSLLDRNPEISSVQLTLASALLNRIARGSGSQAWQDWDEVIALATTCRDTRREWGGPSEEAIEILCNAALLNHDPGSCLRWGREPPGGVATNKESRSSGVLRQVVRAALISGRREVVEEALPRISSEYERALLEGQLAERDGDMQQAMARYEDAVTSSRDPSELSESLSALASTGMWPLPRLDEVLQADNEQADLILAMSEMSHGQHAKGEQRLRPYKSRLALELMALIQDDAGDIDSAIATLHEKFDRFQDAGALVRIGELLASRGEIDRAITEVDSALSLAPAGTFHRFSLQRLRIDLAAGKGAWAEVVSHAIALIAEEGGNDPTVVWALLVGLNNTGRIPEAVRFLEGRLDLTLKTSQEAALFLTLAREITASAYLIERTLDIAGEFQEDESICSMALMLIYLRSADLTLHEEQVARLHSLTEAFIVRFPESEYFRRIEFESVEDLIPQLREGLESRNLAISETARQVVEQSYPQGLLSVMAGRTYAEVLLRRGAGIMPIGRPDALSRDREKTQAATALDGSVLVDTSVLTTWSLIPEHWSTIVASFREIHVHLAAALDAQNARVQTSQPSTGNLVWNPESEQLVLLEADPSDVAAVSARAAWVTERISECHSAGAALLSTEELAEVAPERVAPWLGPIEHAKASGLFLLSDDVGQQRLAEGEGVRVFGSIALLDVLVDTGALDRATVEDLRFKLLRAWAVDLLPSEAEIVRIAEEDGWGSGPAAMQFSRAAVWRDPAAAFASFRVVLQRAVQARQDSYLNWTGAALRGAARASANDASWLKAAASLTTYAVLLLNWSPEALASVSRQSKSIAAEVGRVNPLAATIGFMNEILIGQIGQPFAANEMVRLISQLDESDRLVALRQILPSA